MPRERIVPFLTSKHTLDYCLSYAERARQQRFPSLVVLGGDKHVGPPRVRRARVAAAARRIRAARAEADAWRLGQPERRCHQARSTTCWTHDFTAEFYLTQIVSHHTVAPVARVLEESTRRGLTLPGLFGVFYYRSAKPKTLATLGRFLPVPAEDLTREFAAGASPEEVCARTIRALRDVGARHFYISNLPLGRAQTTLDAIVKAAGLDERR